jgi:hypothetical protein
MFALGWRKVKTLRNELQHHLYMADHVDVIESHRLADEATAGLQQRVWKKAGITRLSIFFSSPWLFSVCSAPSIIGSNRC